VLFLHNMLDSTLSSGLKTPPYTAIYLEHRVKKEPEDGNPALICLRHIAVRLTTGVQSLEHCVTSLCVLAAPNARNLFTPYHAPWQPVKERDLESHLLTAAVYVGHEAVIDAAGAPRTDSEYFGVCSNLAAESGCKSMIERYLRGAYVNNRCTALHRVSAQGSVDLVRFVFNYKTDIAPWRFDPAMRSPNEFLALAKALRTPNPEIYDFIIAMHGEHGVAVTPDRHIAVLRTCAQRGWDSMTEHLLDHYGADPNFEYAWSDGRTPVAIAAQHGHMGVVKILLKRGARVQNSATKAAAWNGHLDIVRVLIAHQCDTIGAVVLGARGGYGDVVSVLLECGADANEEDGDLSAACYALLREHSSMFYCLVKHGATVPTPEMYNKCADKLRKDGSQSMLELFESWCSAQTTGLDT
jgi:ankyrin repeat protein